MKRNGVQVRIHHNTAGPAVEASCACLGYYGRTHSTLDCPLRKRQVAAFVAAGTADRSSEQRANTPKNAPSEQTPESAEDDA